MNKQLNFEYKGTAYCLEYTRKTVAQMEKSGFLINELTEKPVSTLPALFAGAFLANHRFVRQGIIDEIYAAMTNKQELLGKLAEMYNEPVATLMADPEDGAEGNVSWTANW